MPARTSLGRKRNAIRAARGYTLKPMGKKRVALMRGRSATATFECQCGGTGGCQVRLLNGIAVCETDTCTGGCNWVVKVAGIAGNWIARV